MQRGNGLSIEKATVGQATYLRLAGEVDDGFKPAMLLEAIQGKDVIVNLGALKSAGSRGVNGLAQALMLWSEQSKRLVLVECSRAVVTELNLAPKLAKRAVVVSAQVRHSCRQCNAIRKIIYDFGQNQAYSKRGIKQACRRCGTTMTVDENLSTYLAFRQHGPQQPVASDVLEAVEASSRVLAHKAGDTPTEITRPDVPLEVQPSSNEHGRREGTLLGWSTQPSRQRAALVAVGITALAAVTALALIARLSSPPSAQLSVFEQHLRNGRLQEAESLLSEFAVGSEMSAPAVQQSPDKLEAAREQLQASFRARILDAFQQGKYVEIIALMESTKTLEPSATPVAFAVGESYRLVHRLAEAAPYYGIVVDGPSAGRFMDDALFWRAESMLLNHSEEEAIALFERVVELKGSNFVTSAKRRLETLRDREPFSGSNPPPAGTDADTD